MLVATPGGGAGQGGIDRVMAGLHEELERGPDDLDVRLLATRGSGHLAFAWTHLLHFCGAMAFARLTGGVDLVHINLASYGSTYRKIVIAAWARTLRLPYVIHLHGSEYRSFWTAGDSFLNRRIKTMFSRAATIIVLGTPWRDFIRGRIPKTRIEIVPNAVHQPSLPHVGGGDTVHILFLGRIGDRKGTPDLVRAFARMRGVEGWRATIAGDGPTDELRQEVAQLGLADRVAVPGWLGPEDTAKLLAAGDVLTLPSVAENLPMSVIEAMAWGLGIVTTPVGAVEDIIVDGETGLLVPPRDDEALAEGLTALVTDHELRARLGAAAQKFQREQLSIEHYARRMRAVWQEAARKDDARLIPSDAISVSNPRQAESGGN